MTIGKPRVSPLRFLNDEGTESAEVATSAANEPCSVADTKTVRSLRLNETRFGPIKKSSRIYLDSKNLDTF